MYPSTVNSTANTILLDLGTSFKNDTTAAKPLEHYRRSVPKVESSDDVLAVNLDWHYVDGFAH